MKSKFLTVPRRPVIPPKKTVQIIESLHRDIKKEIKENGFDSLDRCMKNLKKKWKLERKHHGGVSRYLFISKKYGLVVKLPYFCSSNPAQVPSCSIFTKLTKVLRYTTDRYFSYIAIQPIADVCFVSRRKASIVLTKWQERTGKNLADDHMGNVAIYRGKAVVIDW